MLKINRIVIFLRDLSDSFVNHEKFFHQEEQYRARILASSLIIFAGFCLLTAPILLRLYINGSLEPQGLIISTFIGVFYIGCLFAFKKTANTFVISHAMATPLFISLVYSSFITGGPSATSNEIMLLIPLLVYFTGGKKAALFWTVCALISQLIFFLLYKEGFEFTQTMDQEAQIEQGLLHWMISLCGIMSMARIYQKTHSNLVNQRDKRESDNLYLSSHDLLTGANNRQELRKSLENYLKSTIKHQLTFSIIIIDISRLHRINEQYGYSAGDAILSIMANRLKHLKDIRTIARINGDQFAVLTHAKNKDFKTQTLTEKILEELNEPFCIEQNIITPSIHLGISTVNETSVKADELLLAAESSLRKAKASQFSYIDK